MNLQSVVQRLERFAPSSLAEGWDNVGLLIEPSSSKAKLIKNVMLTNDLTEDVLFEAVKKQIDLIISYHPPIFRPLKRITQKSWKERLTAVCLKKDIALYSPHTAYDVIKGGVNDWLIEPYGPGETKPITPKKSKKTIVISEVAQEDYNALKLILSSEVKLAQDESSLSKFEIELSGEGILESVVGALMKIEGGKYLKNCKVEDKPSDLGSGRYKELDVLTSIEKAVEITKHHLGIPKVRLAMGIGASMSSTIGTVAVCAGSGSSVLSNAPPADLWVTGEMSHHEVLDAVHKGTSVILCEHSNTERGFLTILAQKFGSEIFEKEDLSFFVSELDKDPLIHV